MDHWTKYRGKWQAKNFIDEMRQLSRDGKSQPEIVKYINNKYSEYGVDIKKCMVSKELSAKRPPPPSLDILAMAWNQHGLERLALTNR